MENRNTSCLCTDAHITFWIIDTVNNISVLQIIHQLFYRHFGTVIFRLFRRRAKMGNHDAAFLACSHRIREIRYIFTDFAGFDSIKNSFFIHKQISRKI